MPDSRLPRRLLYGKLTVGQRSVGRPKKCFIDHVRANLLKCNIKPSDLEVLASARDIRRTVCDTGLRSFLNGWIATSEERHAARHTASTKPKTGPRCPQCSRVCASDFGLRSHIWSLTRPATLSSSATSLSNSTDFRRSSSINIHTKLLALWCQHKLNSGIKKLNFLFKMLTILEADVHHPPKSNTSFPNPNKKIYAQHF